MANKTSIYSGIELDTLYEKGLGIQDHENGWIRLSSSSEEPVSIDNVVSTGFFAVDYWTNGPSDLSGFALTNKGPLLIYTSKLGDTVTQQVWFFGPTVDSYHRVSESGTWGNWVRTSLNEDVSQGSTAPANPEDGQVWIDTSSSFPSLKAYDSATSSWKLLDPGDAMYKSVYDSTGKGEDLFTYADDAIDQVSYSGGVDYNTHMNDTTVHVSSVEVAAWDNKATNSSFGLAISDAKDELRTAVTAETTTFSDETTALTQKISAFETDLNGHVSDTSIHFSNGYAAQKAILDAKADGNHTHHKDGKVKIDASMVVGVLDEARIPSSVKDITRKVADNAAKDALTTADVDVGDWVYVVSTKLLWYVSGADGTTPLYQKFSTGGTAYSWTNLDASTIPTTISGLGITDLNTKTEIDNMVSSITNNNSAAQTNLNAITAKTNLLTRANIIKAQKLQSSLDQAIETLAFINSYTV